MTINNKSERNYRGKCLGWPVTSYGAGVSKHKAVDYTGDQCHYDKSDVLCQS